MPEPRKFKTQRLTACTGADLKACQIGHGSSNVVGTSGMGAAWSNACSGVILSQDGRGSEEASEIMSGVSRRVPLVVPAASTPGRGRNMQAIRRANTKPETALRSALHRAGLRFRKDYRIDLSEGRVRPDVVFTRVRVAVFLDGCFWHCCPEHGRRPTVNTGYWSPKLERNVERDRRNTAALRKAGWTVVRIWEHQDIAEAVKMVEAAVHRARNEQMPR